MIRNLSSNMSKTLRAKIVIDIDRYKNKLPLIRILEGLGTRNIELLPPTHINRKDWRTWPYLFKKCILDDARPKCMNHYEGHNDNDPFRKWKRHKLAESSKVKLMSFVGHICIEIRIWKKKLAEHPVIIWKSCASTILEITERSFSWASVAWSNNNPAKAWRKMK